MTDTPPALVPEKVKWPRALALEVARDLAGKMGPLCERERIIVAGSLRRRKLEVGDVEIVYIPRWLNAQDPGDLFGREVRQNVVDRLLTLMIGAGQLAQRLNINGSPSWGAVNKLAVHTASGMPVDFFATTEECWWSYVVCRTGGKASNKAICTAANDMGWMWHPYEGCFERLSGTEKGTRRTIRSEEEVFAFVGLPYVPPEERK